MQKVKIYDIKQGLAAENAKKLLSADNKYFYWNDAKFSSDEINDIFFIVNRPDKWVCYTKISKKAITANHDPQSQTATFSDSGATYLVDDPKASYNEFIRFDVLEKRVMPGDWNWSKQLGRSETFNLVTEGVQGETKRISKIDDLKKIFADGESLGILNRASEFIKNGKPMFVEETKFETIKTSSGIEMRILTAIKTKPFILLAGISGIGKSRLVRTLAYKTCPQGELQKKRSLKPGNFELIPVRPNWHDSSELMGYVSRINGEKYITTTFLQFIADAWKYKEVPFFLCLDEMNLAPVEQYFAEYLSIIETRRKYNNEITTDYLLAKESFEDQVLYDQILKRLGLEGPTFKDGIRIPKNLVVIGTVNMDETAHSFSRKVLDRAMTFEMNKVDLDAGLDKNNEDWSYPKECIPSDVVLGEYTAGHEVVNKFAEGREVIDFLKDLNDKLEGTPFKIAYRVRDEFLIYCYYASFDKSNKNWLSIALDEMISMKILSRIEGDEAKTGEVLRNLQDILHDEFEKSRSKLKEMETRLQNSGYTSFWS